MSKLKVDCFYSVAAIILRKITRCFRPSNGEILKEAWSWTLWFSPHVEHVSTCVGKFLASSLAFIFILKLVIFESGIYQLLRYECDFFSGLRTTLRDDLRTSFIVTIFENQTLTVNNSNSNLISILTRTVTLNLHTFNQSCCSDFWHNTNLRLAKSPTLFLVWRGYTQKLDTNAKMLSHQKCKQGSLESQWKKFRFRIPFYGTKTRNFACVND